ncbi:hypothetical protein AAD018_001830 [Aestuariibius insulae]|uniref:flagellar biosynthesis protein FlgN n=1 Tax=Aestuariibius insulae TaxID=2058287 RepID=UPI00345EB533
MTSEVLTLLQAERAALLSGSFSDLPAISDRIERLFDRRLEPGIDQDGLQFLRDMATRNQTLITAALDGIRDARARLQHLRTVADTLSTYDKIGQRVDVTVTGLLLERKL